MCQQFCPGLKARNTLCASTPKHRHHLLHTRQLPPPKKQLVVTHPPLTPNGQFTLQPPQTPATGTVTPPVTPHSSMIHEAPASFSDPSPTAPQTSTASTHTPHRHQNWKQYNNLPPEAKEKVETVLFLMNKFAVGDAFIHELSMAIDGMPKSYLIKQCRDQINSTCLIKSTPGPEPGAQVSFREALANKLRQLAS